MAGRPISKIAPVGSMTWITNEHTTIRQLGEQDFEDFAFSARGELEWLNEHMADIFERSQVDMAELLKTPGRLRGKTPRTARQQLRQVEPFGDVFGANKPAAILPAGDNRFYNALSQLPSNGSRVSPSREKSSGSKSPNRLVRKQQQQQQDVAPPPPPPPPPPKKVDDTMRDSGIEFSQVEGPATQVNDSGIWSASSEYASQQSVYPSRRKSTPVDVPIQEEAALPPPAPAAAPKRESDGRTTRQSFRTAHEDEASSERPPSPPQKVPKSAKKSPEKPKSQRVSPVKAISRSPKKDAAPAPEPRRSGRLRSGRGSTDSESSNHENEVLPPSSPPVTRPAPPQKKAESFTEKAADAGYPQLPSEPAQAQASEPEPVPAGTPVRHVEEKAEAAQQAETQTTPASERSGSGSPEPVIRKSILNFASLPAREPLTNKKKSLGVRATRESHLEQLRANGTSRASWMNRKGNGKSLGAANRPVDTMANSIEDREEDEPKPVEKSLKRKSEQQDTTRSRKKSKSINPVEVTAQEEDSNGETEKDKALHNKISTQRLHEKIQQLGKVKAPRETHSVSVLAAEAAYPDLSQLKQDQPSAPMRRPKSVHQSESARAVTDESSQEREKVREKTRSESFTKPSLARSHTEPRLGVEEEPIRRPDSPKKTQTARMATLTRTMSDVSAPPPRSPAARPRLSKSFSEVQHHEPDLQSPLSPRGEGTISAVKTHTASVFKKAKEMLFKSSVSSASAKIESLSPVPRWQNINTVKKTDVEVERSQPSVKSPVEQLYPDLESVAVAQQLPEEVSVQKSIEKPIEKPVVAVKESRQTRGSRSEEVGTEKAAEKVAEKVVVDEVAAVDSVKEGRQTRNSRSRETPQEEVTKPEPPLMKSPRKLKNAAREEELRQVREQRRKHQEEMLRKEKEELRRRQQAEQQREKEEQQRKAIEVSSDSSSSSEDDEEEEAADREENRGRFGSSAEPERPPSRLQKAGSRFQKPAENKRPSRPVKEAPKSKPAPVNIRIGTASQREMQDQRSKMTAPTGSSLISALKSSFEPSLNASASQSSLQSVPSNSSTRSGSNTGTSKQLKSLTAAANQLKKEQEERERKMAAKREIERRRQENQRRQIQEEEQKKMRQKPAQAVPPSAKTLSRIQSVANVGPKLERLYVRLANKTKLRQKSEEPENKRLEYQTKAASFQKSNASKRALQQESSSDDLQNARLAPPKPGGPAYQQEGAKKRRTGEFEEEQRARPAKEMAPPIRQSAVRGGLGQKSGLPHGYVAAAAGQSASSSSSAAPSMLRPPTKPGSVPHVEGVKFSKEKLRFAPAEASTSASGPSTSSNPTANPTSNNPAFKTPGTSKKSMRPAKTPAGIKESPIYQNGELIELPEIPTDSEDSDSDTYPPTSSNPFRVPDWAESPELRAQLQRQQTMNPEEVFGPMARLDMEAIFTNRNERQMARFRTRTSSANWNGADRLTPAEIAADHEARLRMIEQGGWVYQPAP
ncbi:hypothetical protein L873DRAFT_1790261 [Choiromyces venosus 120613-1]|uniref:Inner centromere protein ARK-binding domain-containing protein n=1 Tax=Choiromyces venosus 120613-1 TaxID=1336337 RepID=A0A3N4JNT8_9PEZI|nr:hypothetical protein L873DRAFT_1790261 [Choiromyces venosus 120613-1]